MDNNKFNIYPLYTILFIKPAKILTMYKCAYTLFNKYTYYEVTPNIDDYEIRHYYYLKFKRWQLYCIIR